MVLLVAIACTRPQPAADSTAAGASTSAAPTLSPSDSGGRADTPAVVARDPIQEQATPIQTGGKAPRPTGGVTTQPGFSGDGIVGRVGEHGADPITFIAITTSAGTQTRISSGQLGMLAAVKGAEVWAQGRRDGNAFIVDTFEVRRANDRAVEDGIVSVSGTTVTVRTARGAAITYPGAPTALRNAAGARVWITPPVAGQAPSFGIIRPRAPDVPR
jgi:hypothetical protein